MNIFSLTLTIAAHLLAIAFVPLITDYYVIGHGAHPLVGIVPAWTAGICFATTLLLWGNWRSAPDTGLLAAAKLALAALDGYDGHCTENSDVCSGCEAIYELGEAITAEEA